MTEYLPGGAFVATPARHLLDLGEMPSLIKIRESLRSKPEQKDEVDDTQSLLLI